MEKFKKIKNTKIFIFDFWNSLFIITLVIFTIQHLYFGTLHYHETDSSRVYDFMKDSSSETMKSYISSHSPNSILNIRFQLAELSQNISFRPLKKFIELPYLSTYTPLMGFIYSQIKMSSFEDFYRIASFITGLVLQISSILLYITCLKFHYPKRVAFIVSLPLLTFYSTNSYSYHLGSTIWYILSICTGIFLLTLKRSIPAATSESKKYGSV